VISSSSGVLLVDYQGGRLGEVEGGFGVGAVAKDVDTKTGEGR